MRGVIPSNANTFILAIPSAFYIAPIRLGTKKPPNGITSRFGAFFFWGIMTLIAIKSEEQETPPGRRACMVNNTP